MKLLNNRLFFCSTLAITLCCLLLVGCSFSRQSASSLPLEAQSIVLECEEPYGELCRALRRKLWRHSFKVVEHGEGHPRLKILESTVNNSTISLFPDGKSSQYQLTMRVSAELHTSSELSTAERGVCPIKVAIGQSVVDNPTSSLAKSSEVEMGYRLLYDQVAERIVLRLLTILAATHEYPTQEYQTEYESGPKQVSDSVDAVPKS